jgi:transposase-like protein
MSTQRRHYAAEEKVSILRRHLVEKVPVSELCEQLGLQPTVFYRWQKTLFDNGAAAFAGQGDERERERDKRIALLEEKLEKKNEVVAELMEEHVALKKSLGAL